MRQGNLARALVSHRSLVEVNPRLACPPSEGEDGGEGQQRHKNLDSDNGIRTLRSPLIAGEMAGEDAPVGSDQRRARATRGIDQGGHHSNGSANDENRNRPRALRGDISTAPTPREEECGGVGDRCHGHPAKGDTGGAEPQRYVPRRCASMLRPYSCESVGTTYL